MRVRTVSTSTGAALSIALFLPMLGCQGSPPGPRDGTGSGWEPQKDAERITSPSAPASDVSTLVGENTMFATQLHQQLAMPSGNLVYSPYSVSLNMAELDATSSQPGVPAALGFTLPVDRLNAAFDALDLQLTSISGATETGHGLQYQEASAAWGTLASGSVLEQYYGAVELTGSDVYGSIAAWQSTASPGPSIPASLIGTCDGALVTLAHIDAGWQTAFDPKQTSPAPFTRQGGSVVSVPFMNLETPLAIETGGAVQAVQLPYDGGRLALLIVMPSDLGTFESTLTPTTLSSVISGLVTNDVQLSLPKFSLTNTWDVLKALEAMGLSLPGGGDHWQITQGADIEVSETGTIASATTTTTHTPSAAMTPTVFSVDEPFDFFLRDEVTGTVLFAGRVADPSQP